MFGAIAGGIASALAGGAMSKLFGGGQKAASGGIQGDVLATDNNTVGMGDAGIKSAIQGSNVPNPDEAVPSFVPSVDKQASHFVHIPGLSYSGVKSPTECQQSLFESHFASRQSLTDCPVAF